MTVAQPDAAAPGGWDAHLHVFDGRPLPGAQYLASVCTVDDWAALARPLGIGRAVLALPSVHGADNPLLLQALASVPGRHRDVVVLAGNETDAQLDRLADAVPGPAPAYASLLVPLLQALGEPAAHGVLHDAPARLLG